MPGYQNWRQPPSPESLDVSYALGWTADIWAGPPGEEKLLRRDCSLPVLVRASALFERLARDKCAIPLEYGEEAKLTYVLPRGIASAAFLRILDWIHAINDISAHGEIEDPQITTFDSDGLMHLLRLLQAANLLELKWPYQNQKRLPDMINAHVKRAFDTKNNGFKDITITDLEIGLIWDVGQGNRVNSMVKLMLALFVDARDLRAEFPNKYKDNILQRFDALVEKNDAFRSAAKDVKIKKDVRMREEERERKGLPKQPSNRSRRQQDQRRNNSTGNGGGRNGNSKGAKGSEYELTDHQARALMARPEEFRVDYGIGNGAKYANQYYGQGK